MSVGGMDCADCARTIERAVGRLDGASVRSGQLPGCAAARGVPAGSGQCDCVVQQVRGLGYRVDGHPSAAGASLAWWRRRDFATAIAALLVAAAVVIDAAGGPGLLSRALYGAGIVVGGWRIARAGLVALRATRRPDMNLLMALAAVGAAAIGAWLEAALVVVLFSLGQALEVRAVERARRELESLVTLTPERARVRRGGREVEIAAAELVVGDIVVARPGERLAAC